MHRPIIYDQAQARDYDVAHGWREGLYGLGQAVCDILGSSGTVVTGLAGTQTATPSLTINIAAGDIYQLANTDTTAYGPLLADTTQTFQQGFAPAQTVLLTTSGLASGQSRYALITAAFSQADTIPADDPNGGILNYLNASNPSGAPWSGPGNAGTPQNTRRQGLVTIGVTYGAVATTGSEVPPNAPGGTVGLYLVDLAFGQTAVTNAQILLAGPSAGSNVPSNYPQAPFLAGLAQRPSWGSFAGNPNGNVAGTAIGTPGSPQAPNIVFDTTHLMPWWCAATGSAATAVWKRADPALGQCALSVGSTTTAVLKPVNGQDLTIGFTRQIVPSAGVTLTVGNCNIAGTPGQALAANTTYFISARMVAGVMTLVAWLQGSNAHSTDATTGVEIITGQTGDTLVGMLRTDGSGQLSTGLLLSWFNKKPVYFAQAYSTIATTSTSYAELTSAARVNFLAWAGVPIEASHTSGCNGSTTLGMSVAIGLDNSTVWNGALGTVGSIVGANQTEDSNTGPVTGTVAEGFHFLEALALVTTGTGTFTGGMNLMTFG